MFFDKERQKQYEADLKEWKNSGADKKSKPKNPFEEEAKQFLANMKIEDPENLYSAIGHLDNGMHYVTLPNIVSKTIIEQIDNVVKELNVNVPLGIEWISGSNWYLMMPVYIVIYKMNRDVSKNPKCSYFKCIWEHREQY